MKIEKYRETVNLTKIYPEKVDNFGLAYCWLGLIGETEECFSLGDKSVYNNKKDIFKELGDVLWYTTAISLILEIELEEILKLKEDIELNLSQSSILPNSLSFAENIKKFYRDNKEVDKELAKAALANNLACLFVSFGLDNDNISEIIQMNYDKLIKRRETNTLHGDGSNREDIEYK